MSQNSPSSNNTPTTLTSCISNNSKRSRDGMESSQELEDRDVKRMAVIASADDVTLEAVLEALNKQTERIYTLSPTNTVADALAILGKHNILSAPVVSANKEFLAIIDMTDILDLVIDAFAEASKTGTSGDSSSSTTTTSTKEGLQTAAVLRRTLADAIPRVRSHRRQDVAFLAARLSTKKSLAQVVRTKFLPFNHHRITINDCDSIVVELFSQSDVIRYLAQHPDYMSEVTSQTLQALHLTKPQKVMFVTEQTQVIDAFKMMSQNEFRAVAVEDSDGHLLTEFTINALRGLGEADVPTLMHKTVGEFLLAARQFHQPQDSHISPITCTATDTLRSVILQLKDASRRNVYVLGGPDSKRVTNVITNSDVLRVVFGPAEYVPSPANTPTSSPKVTPRNSSPAPAPGNHRMPPPSPPPHHLSLSSSLGGSAAK